MKIKERALALLLSMVMVLTFMPALAFADDEAVVADGISMVEEAKGKEVSERSADLLEEADQEAAQERCNKHRDLGLPE